MRGTPPFPLAGHERLVDLEQASRDVGPRVAILRKRAAAAAIVSRRGSSASSAATASASAAGSPGGTATAVSSVITSRYR